MVELAPTLDKGGASAAGFSELRDREEVFVSQAEVLRDRSRTHPGTSDLSRVKREKGGPDRV